jgi:hypothetical protein
VSDESDPSFTWQLGFDKDELSARRGESRTFILPETGLKFIDDHFGPRPGCLHTLLGSTGRGKSTLVQSLILEWGKKASILLYLSEESIDRVEVKLFEKEADAGYLTTRLHVTHEEDILRTVRPDNVRLFLMTIEAKIHACSPKILIIDNLTTSQFYEGKFSNVMPLLSGLRMIAAKYKLPIFLVCHTKKGVNETTKGLINPDDVRGSSILGMTSDYFYTFYRVQQTGEFGTTKIGTFVYVNKSRDHDNQDFIYRLNYDVNRKRYVSDTLANFKAFKEFMQKRDKA